MLKKNINNLLQEQVIAYKGKLSGAQSQSRKVIRIIAYFRKIILQTVHQTENVHAGRSGIIVDFEPYEVMELVAFIKARHSIEHCILPSIRSTKILK